LEKCKRNKNIRPILCDASLEAGKVTIQEFQISDYRRNIFSELSDQKRAKFEVVSALNKVLRLETSFAGNSMPIERKDFANQKGRDHGHHPHGPLQERGQLLRFR